MPKRCLLLSTCTIRDVLRGAEKQVVTLAAGLRRRGWEVLMGVPPGSKVEEAARAVGVPSFHVNVRPEFSPWAFWLLHRRCRVFRPSVLHLNDPHAVSMGGYARLFRSAPLVLAHRRLAKTPHHTLSYLQGAEGLICISEAVRANMREAGYPDARMAVVFSSVDPQYLSCDTSRRDARARMGIAPETFVFVMIAAIFRQKDHATLVRAFARFRGRANVQLVIVGEGPCRADVESLIRAKELDAQVRCVGALSGEALLCAYRAADVVVYSTHREGLGVAALEAQAMGLPVIGTRVVGLTEAIDEGRTGLLVEHEDVEGLAVAMDRLYADRALMERLGRAGPDWVRSRFSEDAMVEGVIRAYQDLGRKPFEVGKR